MPGWLTKLFSGKINPIKDIADIADRFITTKEEKLRFEIELKELEKKWEQIAQDNVTERHKLDMSSDSWLSKNVRPITLLFLLGMVTLFAFTDGNIGEFSIQKAYVALYEKLLLTAFSFYFVGRSIIQGIEKYNKTKDKKTIDE